MLLLVSDIQTYFRPNAYYSTFNPLDVTIDALKEVYDLAYTNGCKAILHNGDLFEFSNPSEITRIKLEKFFNREYKKTGIPFITNIGNHDLNSKLQYKKNRPLTALHTLEASLGSSVFSVGDVREDKDGGFYNYQTYGNLEVYMIPYLYLENQFKALLKDLISFSKHKGGSKKKVLMIHQDINPIIPTSTITKDLEEFKYFDYVLAGHIHERQQLSDKFLILGSLLQQKGNDLHPTTKGVYLIDETHKEIKPVFHRLDGYPTFVYVNGIEEAEEYPNNYILIRPKSESISDLLSDTEVDQELDLETVATVEDKTLEGRKNLVKDFCEAKGLEDEVLTTCYKLLEELSLKQVEAESKKVTYNKVVIEGYGSYASEIELELGSNPITLYRGKNGSGKSTGFGALYWVETGKFLKPVKQDDIITEKKIRPTSWRGTRVMLYLSIDSEEYVLARHIKFNGDTYGQKGGSNFFVFKKEEGSYQLLDLNSYVSEEVQQRIGVLGKKDDKNKHNALWESVRGIPNSLLTSTILFDSTTTRLILDTDTAKSEMLEKLLDTRWVSAMLELVKERQEAAKEGLQELTSERNKINVESLETQIRYINQAKEDFRKEKERDIKILEDKLKDLLESKKVIEAKLESDKKAVESYRESIGDIEVVVKPTDDANLGISAKKEEIKASTERHKFLDTDLRSLDKEINIAEAELGSIKNSIKSKVEAKEKLVAKLGSADAEGEPTVCDACGTVLEDVTKYKQHVVNEISVVDQQVNELKSEAEKVAESIEYIREQKRKKKNLVDDELVVLSKLKQELYNLEVKQKNTYKEYNEYRDKVSGIENILRQVESNMSNTQTRLESVNKNILDREQELQKVSNKTKEFEDVSEIENKIKSFKTKQASLDVDIKEMEAYISTLNTIRTKVLITKGLKAYLTYQKFIRLKIYIYKYCKEVGTDIKVELDEKLRFVIKSLVGTTYRDVHKLSDGQLTLANLIWIFSLHDLVREKNNVNVLILDEPYTNLDPANSSKINDLIQYKATNTNIHLITHSTLLNFTNTEVIEVEGGINKPTTFIKA